MKDNQSLIIIIVHNDHSHQLSNYIPPFIKRISEKGNVSELRKGKKYAYFYKRVDEIKIKSYSILYGIAFLSNVRSKLEDLQTKLTKFKS